MTQASVLKITSPKEVGGKSIVTNPRADNTLFKEVMAKTEPGRETPTPRHNKQSVLSSSPTTASLQSNPDKHQKAGSSTDISVKTDRVPRADGNIDSSIKATQNIDDTNLETPTTCEEEVLGRELSSLMSAGISPVEWEGEVPSYLGQVTPEAGGVEPKAVELKEPNIGQEPRMEEEVLNTPYTRLEKEPLQVEKPTEEPTIHTKDEELTPVATVVVPLQEFNYDYEEVPSSLSGDGNEKTVAKEQNAIVPLTLQENAQGVEEIEARAKNHSSIDPELQSKVEAEAKSIEGSEFERNHFENQSLKTAIPLTESIEAKIRPIPKNRSLSSEEEVKKNTVAGIAGAIAIEGKDDFDLSNPSFLNNADEFESNLLNEGSFTQTKEIEFGGFLTIDQGQLSITFDGVENKPLENVPHRAEQISIAIREALSHGRGQVSVSLYPEALGQVDVKIEFAKMGSEQVITSIKILADRPETLKLLGEGIEYLKSSIKEVVQTSDNASLSLDLRQGDDSNGAAQEAKEQQEALLGRVSLQQEEGTVVRQYEANYKITNDSVDIRI